MPLQDITPLPDPPARSDPPDDFVQKADAFLSALPQLADQINALATQLEVAAALIAVAPAYADAGLLALTGKVPAADRLPYFTGSTTSALATFTSAARTFMAAADPSAQLSALGFSAFFKTLIDDGDAATLRASLGNVPVPGDYQPLDSDLSAIAMLATTSFGRSLLTLADAAAARNAFGPAISGASGSWKINFGALVVTVRDFVIGSNTTVSVPYGDGHEYSSWVRAFTDGDDGQGDRSIVISGPPGLTTATVRSNGSSSVTASLLSIGI